MAKVLLDTDVVINILKKRDETINKIVSLKGYEFYISPIVVAEIYAGARDDEIPQIEELFSYFKSIQINDDIGKIAGKYANKYKKAFNKISLEDYMIAAIANYYKLTLWTYNKKHYPMDDLMKL
jgi:predicted nucleic acid-binding protein